MPVSSYTVSFNNTTPGVMLSSAIVSPCVGDVCKYQLAASTYCQTTGSIGVAVSAMNELGAGLSSNPEYIGKSPLYMCCVTARVYYNRERESILLHYGHMHVLQYFPGVMTRFVMIVTSLRPHS